MASFNKVIIMGNLTRDPELKSLPTGTSTLRFTLAMNRKGVGNNGKPFEEATFVPVDAFGKMAETIAQYCLKGSPLHVEGRLRMNTWEKNGVKHSQLSVLCETFQFIGGASANREQS